MNITAGEKLKRYSEVFDIPIKEVEKWVNGYVNDPENNYPGPFEATETERLKSIGAYIDWRLANSSWGVICKDLAQSKKEAA